MGPLAILGINAAAGAAESAGSYLGGRTGRRIEQTQLDLLKRKFTFQGELWQQLQHQLRNPGAFRTQMQQMITPQLNQILGQASQRVGLDSGAGYGEMARQGQGMMARLGAQRQMSLMQLLRSLAG